MSNLNMCRAVADAMYQAVHGAILQRETHPGLELYLKWVP